MIFLDTNICIHFLKGEYLSVRENLLATPPKEIKIPVIVHSELLFGVRKSIRKKENLAKIEKFLMPFEIVSYAKGMSEIYADIRSSCEQKGTLVGPNDLLIAAMVLSYGGTLATRNLNEFRRVENLKIAEW